MPLYGSFHPDTGICLRGFGLANTTTYQDAAIHQLANAYPSSADCLIDRDLCTTIPKSFSVSYSRPNSDCASADSAAYGCSHNAAYRNVCSRDEYQSATTYCHAGPGPVPI